MKKVYFSIAVVLVLGLNFAFSAWLGDDFKLRSTYYFASNTDYEYPAQIALSSRGLVVAGRKELIQFDREGKSLWKKPLYAFGALCASSGEYIAVCERNSGEFYILDKNGDIVHHTEKYGRIESVKAFDSNSFGFLTDHGVYIYSGTTDKVFFLPSQPGDIIDYSYSDLHKKVAIIYLDSEVNCYINLLTVTGEITSGKIEQEGLIFDVYLDRDRILVLKEDGIHEYNYFLSELSESRDELEAGDAIVSDEGKWFPSLIYSCNFEEGLMCGQLQGSYGIWKNGKKLFSVDAPAKNMMAMKGGYLIRGSDLSMWNEKGERLYSVSDSDEITDVIKFNPQAFAVVFANRIEFYSK